MELCDTDLEKQVKRQRRFDAVEVFNLMVQMGEASKYLAFRKIIHRDIKPGNILVNNLHNDYQYKLADFGCVS